MGFSNPSARAYATPTMVSTQGTNREQVGGPAKAGIPSRVGLSWFPRLAIVNGAAGHNAPQFAGNSYPMAFAQGRVSSLYPISTTNQLSGVGAPRWGMTRTPADGVNLQQRAAAARTVHGFNALWPARASRWWLPPPLPLNPVPVAPGRLTVAMGGA